MFWVYRFEMARLIQDSDNLSSFVINIMLKEFEEFWLKIDLSED
jgi:hypothetical protein